MKKFNRKKLFYSTGSVVISVIFIAIVILFNYIATSLTDSFSLKYDLTEFKIHELSDGTVEFVKKVEMPINIYYFVDDITITSGITDILERIAAINKNVKFQVVSADKNPALAQKFTTADTSLSLYTIVVDSGTAFKTIAYEDFYAYNPISQKYDILVLESKVVSAINTVSRENKITVGFTTGHGEDAAEAMKTILQDDNISVLDTNLATDDFKSECDVLCIAAPITDFTSDEIDRLDSYIKSGGNVQLYFTFNSEPMPKLYSYLNECGIAVGDNVVFETDSSKVIGNAGYVFSANYEEHLITKNLIENSNFNIMQLSRTITPIDEYKDGFTLKTLQSTSEKGVAQNIVTAEDETSGKLSLSVLAEYSDDTTKGGSLLVSGSYISYAGTYAEYNKDFLLSSVILMSQPEESYDISPKLLWLTRLNISQLNIIVWMIVVVYLFPAIVFICGLFVWYRRRHL